MITQNLSILSDCTVGRPSWRQRALQLIVRMRFQLLGGIFFGVMLPVILRANGVFDAAALFGSQASTLGTLAALLLGFLILRKTTALPGSAAYINVLPAFIISYGIVVGVFFAFRLDYSRYQFLVSFVGTVIWFYIIVVALLRTRRPVFGVVAGGRANAVRHLGSVDVIVFDSVMDAERNSSVPIVADFRANSMTDEWERYLAEQAIRGRAVYNAKQLVESLSGKVQIEHLSENSLGQLRLDQIYRPAKQYLDTLMAAIAVVVLSPVLVGIGVAIRLDSDGPSLFRQVRIGYRGQPFTVYKFRSMRVQRPEDLDRSSDMTRSEDDRITRVGRVIRKLRVDELPQLLNVLKGEMSWIGPRPETINLSEWYEQEIPFYRIRHAVKPGITGWAQVRQGHVTSVDDVREKLEYDLFYVKHFSIWFDVLIVVHTIKVMLTGKGAK